MPMSDRATGLSLLEREEASGIWQVRNEFTNNHGDGLLTIIQCNMPEHKEL